jgi:hypothetical protein
MSPVRLAMLSEHMQAGNLEVNTVNFRTRERIA